jgi:hypothetical protein
MPENIAKSTDFSKVIHMFTLYVQKLNPFLRIKAAYFKEYYAMLGLKSINDVTVLRIKIAVQIL